MPLWGATATSKTLPTWLTAEQRKNTYADRRGWILKHPDGTEEILVAAEGLANTFGAANVTTITLDAATYSSNFNMNVYVTFNEVVNVAANATVTVNANSTGFTLLALKGQISNNIRFGVSSQTAAVGNILAIPPQVITGQITDYVANTESNLSVSASVTGFTTTATVV